MIGENQTIRRYKGSATAAPDPDTTLLNMLQPSGRRGEVVLVLKLRSRWIVKKPKAIVGEGAVLKEDRHETQKKPRILVELAHKIPRQVSRKRAQTCRAATRRVFLAGACAST
jgi:hypothetical protein